jgi:hypothetical protein
MWCARRAEPNALRTAILHAVIHLASPAKDGNFDFVHLLFVLLRLVQREAELLQVRALNAVEYKVIAHESPLVFSAIAF